MSNGLTLLNLRSKDLGLNLKTSQLSHVQTLKIKH